MMISNIKFSPKNMAFAKYSMSEIIRLAKFSPSGLSPSFVKEGDKYVKSAVCNSSNDMDQFIKNTSKKLLDGVEVKNGKIIQSFEKNGVVVTQERYILDENSGVQKIYTPEGVLTQKININLSPVGREEEIVDYSTSVPRTYVKSYLVNGELLDIKHGKVISLND